MDEEKFWMLASLVLSGEASDEETQALEKYLTQHPQIRQRWQAMRSLWKDPILPVDTDQPFNRHLQRLSNHLAQPVLKYENAAALPAKKRSLRRSMLFAACIAASLLFCIVFFYRKPVPEKRSEATPQNIVSTKPGSRSRIVLPDGTEVWLNADSRLEYDEKFTQGVRDVRLSGEAYFDVARDKDHPFVIHTSTIDIRVLGTAFNVRSYQNETSTETALLRGSVEIIAHNDPDRKIILKPLEKLVIQNAPAPAAQKQVSKDRVEDKPLMSISRVHMETRDSTAKDILWTRNKLSFDSEPLRNVALKIERWFDVKVNITDEKLKDKLYTAVFDYENLEQVMEALRLTGNFKYAISKNEVTIKP